VKKSKRVEILDNGGINRRNELTQIIMQLNSERDSHAVENEVDDLVLTNFFGKHNDQPNARNCGTHQAATELNDFVEHALKLINFIPQMHWTSIKELESLNIRKHFDVRNDLIALAYLAHHAANRLSVLPDIPNIGRNDRQQVNLVTDLLCRIFEKRKGKVPTGTNEAKLFVEKAYQILEFDENRKSTDGRKPRQKLSAAARIRSAIIAQKKNNNLL
jgi:hypothetical protein